jgi:ABC-type uncharacterized transport system substrate-binding protein
MIGIGRRARHVAQTPRLPTAWREGIEAGGFMAYAFEMSDLHRHNADIIAKILAGAKRGDILSMRLASSS